MTEELKLEAEKFARTEMSHPNEYGMYYCTFLKVAEPREKRIAELEDKLANADYQLEGRDNEVRELEAQIEKMKCCQNCRKFNNLSYDCTCAEVCNEWELRR